MYRCGLRLSEALRLRVKDVEFGKGILVIRDAKGGKDRVVPLPQKLITPLQAQLSEAKKSMTLILNKISVASHFLMHFLLNIQMRIKSGYLGPIESKLPGILVRLKN